MLYTSLSVVFIKKVNNFNTGWHINTITNQIAWKSKSIGVIRLNFITLSLYIITLLITRYHSKISPFALTHLLRRSMKEFTLARTCSCGILSHSLNSALLRSSTECRAVALTLSSNWDHIEKSSGLRSGEQGGHSSDEIKSGKCVLHHFWVALAL